MEQVYVFIEDYVPEQLMKLLKSTVFEIVEAPKGGLLSFGILATLWSASNGMNALIRALNRAHDLEETRSFFKLRFLSIFMTLGMIVVFVVTLLLPVFGHVILEWIAKIIALPPATFELFNRLRWLVGIAVMTTVLMAIYILAPNKRICYKEALAGAIFATVTWQLISYLFSIYVENFSMLNATYGSLGGVIVLMLWFFLSGMVLVIGGEINAVLHEKKNAKNP